MRAWLWWGAILGLWLGVGDLALRPVAVWAGDESSDSDKRKPPAPQPQPPQPPPQPPQQPQPSQPTHPHPSGGNSHWSGSHQQNSYWYQGYPYYYDGSGTVYYPPMYVSGASIFGPQSIQRFLGAGGGGGQTGSMSDSRADDEIRTARSVSPGTISRSQRFIGYGDTYFGKEKYSDAADRYRSAQQTAPSLATPYFRQGFALVALGRYEASAKAFKRGLVIDPDWPKSDFSLDQLYGGIPAAKNQHLDALAAAALGDSSDSDLLFLIGVYLWADGKPDRAKVFFQRGAQLALDPSAQRLFLSVLK